MKFEINDLDDFNLEGKTVLCRVDMNQPVNRETDSLNSTHRIEACAPTLKEISDKGAKLVVLCHQGSDIEYKNFYCTRPHAKVLTELLGKEVRWIDDVCGPYAQEQIKNLKNGEIILMDNVRYMSEEMTLFENKLGLSQEEQAETYLVRKLAPLADLYVCDAFAAAHRNQPSLCGFEHKLPSAMGRLFEKEYVVISELMSNPARPCTFVLGGAKIADAFIMMDTVLGNGTADKVVTGGLAGQVVLAAKGINIGKSNLDFIDKKGFTEYIDVAKKHLEKYGDKIIAPVDVAYVEGDKRIVVDLDNIPDDKDVVDIGDKTIENFVDVIMNSQTVFANGPMGVFEEAVSETGSKAIYEAMAETSAHTVVGGGDSVTAAKKYNITDKLGYVCTGGGALIRFLTGDELPVVSALRYATKTFGNDK
ncbi:MAG: phosphoglycerate kinase [Coriobacteriia bacterium]|nr:phosphoglycerate kinase [Coriobacteriia bacterium]